MSASAAAAPDLEPVSDLDLQIGSAKLTKKEQQLLTVLMKNPGRSITRQHLLETVWGYRTDARTRTVDVHVQRLRRKLGPAASALKTIVRGGYCWFPDNF